MVSGRFAGSSSVTVTTAIAPAFTANLADAFDAVDRADSPAARVAAAAEALAAYAFDGVVITLRDAALSPILEVTAGALHDGGETLQSLPGVVWRRRLPGLERFRSGNVFMVDGTDAWAAREFFGVAPRARVDGADSWIDTDLLVVLVRGAEDELLGIAELTAPRDARQPTETCRREIGGLMRHLGARLAYDNLRAVAERRAERLQRLQEAGAALARSLDEQEIIHELARQTLRATRAEGVVIANPNLQAQTLTTHLRVFRGVERAGGVEPLGDGVIAEVARTGRPVRCGDRLSERAREQAGLEMLSSLDVVGNDVAAASVMAVPMLMGIRLIGVVALYSADGEAFATEDEEVIAIMASQAAIAIANARRYAESEQERRQTEALADVARAVGESLRPGDVLRLILRHSLALLGADGAVIALRNGDYMHIVAAAGEMEMLAGVHTPVASSLMGSVAISGERVVSNEYVQDSHFNRLVHPLARVRRTVVAPLSTARGNIGALAVSNRETPFTEDDGRVLQRLADHVAVAIVNAQLFEEVELATREWKVAFDSIAAGMVVIDDTYAIKRCNARALEFCNAESYPALIGRRFGEALLGESVAAHANGLDAMVASALDSGVAARDTVVDERGGRVFEISITPHPDGGVVVTFDDVSSLHRLITEQRSNAVARERSEAQYERLVEDSSDCIFTVDREGNFVTVNRALLMATNQTREQLVGKPCFMVVDPRDRPLVQELLYDTMRGTRQQAQLRYIGHHGAAHTCLLISSPVVEDGQVVGGLGVVRNISTDQVLRPKDMA